MADPVTILTVVGVGLSANALYEGIKEGNFLQAALGAVGAYYGLGTLATPATQGGATGMEALAKGSENVVDTVGASVGEKLGSQAAAKTIETGTGSAFGIGDAINQGLANTDIFADGAADAFSMSDAINAGAGDAIKNEVAKGGFNLNDSIAQGASWLKDKVDVVMDPVKGFAKDAGILSSGEKTGLLSKGFTFAKDHPEIMQTGMNLVGGYMQGKAEEDMYDDQKREYYKSLSRRGYWAPTDEFTDMTFNPQTRRYE